jgi:uncharacterized protein (DUF433 family)
MSLVVKEMRAPLVTDADGVVRVGGSRVTLDTLVYAFRQGATAEEIVQDYPSLSLPDVYAALSFYLQSRGEVEQYLLERERKREGVRRENEASSDPVGLRERLLARRGC